MQIIATAVRHVVNTCRQISAQLIVAVPTSVCVAMVTQSVLPDKATDTKQAGISQPAGATDPVKAEAPAAKPERRTVAATNAAAPIPLTVMDDAANPVSLIGRPLEADFDVGDIGPPEASQPKRGVILRFVSGITDTAARIVRR